MKDIQAHLLFLLEFKPGTRDLIEPSVQNYLETGKVSGELYNRVNMVYHMAQAEIVLYDPIRCRPPYEKDIHGYELTHSITVPIIDSDGCDGLAWYDFEDEQWHFLTEHVEGAKWRWYYRPFQYEGRIKELIETLTFAEI